jgi:hypothetical protein
VGKYFAKTAYFETEVNRLFNMQFENPNPYRKYISQINCWGFKLMLTEPFYNLLIN